MYDILNVYLENGLRVVIHRIPKLKTASCGIWVKQGSKHEDEQNNGLSHLLEHLMINFENSKNPKFQTLLNDIRSEGVIYNAATTKEFTYYYFTGLAENIEKSLKTLACIMVENETFPTNLFETEKKVVTQEAISFYSSFNQIKERTSQALWGNIGVGKIIVGNIENVTNANMSDVEKIINESYTPENATLVIIGDIDYQRTLDIIEENFTFWLDRKTRDYVDIIEGEPGIYYNQGNGGKSTVISIGFRTPGYMDKSRAYIDIITKIIGDTSLESRLVQAIRVKRGLSYTLGAFSNFYENRGVFAFTSVSSKESVEEVVKLAMQEFNNAKSFGFTEEEMERAKRIIKTTRLLELGDITSQIRFLGKCVSYGQLYSLEQELRTIEKIDLDTLNRVSKDLIREDNMSIAVIGDCNIDNIMDLLKIS